MVINTRFFMEKTYIIETKEKNAQLSIWSRLELLQQR